MTLFVSASVQPFLHVNYYLAFSFGNISVCLHLEWLGTYALAEPRPGHPGRCPGSRGEQVITLY
jgi:hypothetical protein